MDDPVEIIKMMTGGLKHLDLNVKHVVVKSKPHKRSAPKECYNNSYRYISDHYEEKPEYILGYVVVHGVPIEHAWVKVGSQHYDVTLDVRDDDVYYEVTQVSDDVLLAFVNKMHHAPDLYALNRFSSKKQ